MQLLEKGPILTMNLWPLHKSSFLLTFELRIYFCVCMQWWLQHDWNSNWIISADFLHSVSLLSNSRSEFYFSKILTPLRILNIMIPLNSILLYHDDTSLTTLLFSHHFSRFHIRFQKSRTPKISMLILLYCTDQQKLTLWAVL